MAFSVLALAATVLAAPADQYRLYVGTYTDKQSKGIYRFDFDPATGKLSGKALAAEAKSPSFLALHPNGQYLYAVGEFSKFGGKPGGAVSAFAIDPKTGDLKLLNQESSGGAGPCYVVVDKLGKHALVANYGGGSASTLPIGEDGRLGQPFVVQHRGSSVNPKRQEAAHAHSINLDAANRFAFVADLGLDTLQVYRYDNAKGTLTANDPPAARIAPGSGPRHFDFHPDGKHAYAINELANTITVFDYDPERGELKTIQTVSTLPEDFKGESYAADIHVHPSGKFVYGSNRGYHSIAVFTVDAATGKLTPAGHQTADINWPRNFGLDLSGTFLIVANEKSDSLVVFRVDAKTGALEPTGIKAEVSKPVCVKFLPIKR